MKEEKASPPNHEINVEAGPGEIEQVENMTFSVGKYQIDLVIVIRVKPKED